MGLNLIVAIAAFKVAFGTIVRSVIPFITIMLIWLVIVIVYPTLSLGLLGSSLAWREASRQQGRAEATTTALLQMLRSSRPSEDGRQLSVLDLLRDFRPQMAQWLPQLPAARAQLSQELAQTFLAHGDLSAAAELSAAALTDCGDCPTQVVTQLRMADAQLQGNVALIHGELALAEQHTAVGAELARARYPAGHWRRLDADVRQAEVALASRDLDRLRQWLTPAISDLQRRHWPDPLREAQARNLWLSLLRETGSTAEAEVYARHYVDWADRQFGARHSSTLTAHQGLNLVLLLADQLPEARQRLSADVQLASDWLGPSHATTLGLRLQLATLMARQGEPGSALVALESVRNDLLTQTEPDPEILLVTLGNLASRYKDMGQWAAAEASYAQVIEQATQIYRRYLREGAFVPWGEDFGRQCPVPDFDKVEREQREIWMRQGARIAAIGVPLVLLLALGWRWSRRRRPIAG